LRGFFICLSADVRKESHEPRALYRKCKLALMLGTHACATASQDAGMRIRKTLERFRIFVVNVFNIVYRKIALHKSTEIKMVYHPG